MKHTKLAALAGAAAIALTLSACGGGGDPTLPTTPAGGQPTTDPVSTDPATTDPGTTDPATTEPETTVEETTEPAGGEPIPTGDVSIFRLEPVVCTTIELLDSHPDNVEGYATIPGVDCNGPHDVEFFHTEILPEGDFPGDDAVRASADEVCAAKFEEYIGIPTSESGLALDSLEPSEATWEGGDREVLCIVFDPLQMPSGSFEGSQI